MEEEADIATRESEADALTAYHAALSACARGNDVQGTLQVFNTISAHCAQEISTTTHTQESSTTTYAQAVPAEAYDLVLSTCANAGNLVACKKYFHLSFFLSFELLLCVGEYTLIHIILSGFWNKHEKTISNFSRLLIIN